MSWWAQRLARLRGEYTGPPSHPDAPPDRVSLAEWERSRDLRLDIRHGMVSLGNGTDIEFAERLTPEDPMPSDPDDLPHGPPMCGLPGTQVTPPEVGRPREAGYPPLAHGTARTTRLAGMGPVARMFMPDEPPPPVSFREDLAALVRRHGLGAIADVPDAVLVDYLDGCLDVLNLVTIHRDGLLGWRPKHAGGYGDLDLPGAAGGSGGH